MKYVCTCIILYIFAVNLVKVCLCKIIFSTALFYHLQEFRKKNALLKKNK